MAWFISLFLVTSGLIVNSPAEAATTCDPADLYYITTYNNGYPALMKYSGGTKTTVLSIQTSGAPYPDALGVTSSGYGYYIQSTPQQGTAPTITRVDLSTKAKVTYTGTALATASLSTESYPAGAVNPVTGIYYYAVPTTLANYPWDVYAFDTNTNTAIGYVGRISVTGGGGATGDLAFDSDGNLYLSTHNSSSSVMKVAAANVPTTAKTVGTAMAATADAPQNETTYATGLAFMSSETSHQLWSGSYGSTVLHKRTPGATDSTTGITLGDSYLYDLASCATATATVTPKITLKKNVVGRNAGTDQFTLAIEQPSGTSKASATTSGTATGVQSAVAGPVDATTGATYTLRETASGTTNLSNYTTSVSCVNTDTGASISTSGSGGVYTMTYPSSGVTDVTCTITNTPVGTSVTPTITLKKNVISRNAGTDQFTLAIEQPSGTSKASATTSGTATGVQSAVAGPVDATTGATYTLRETASGTTNLSNYTTSVSCVNTDTGDSISTSGSGGVYTMVYPSSGVTDVTCTISNTATVQGTASCSPADVFYTVSQQIWRYSASTGQATQLGTYGFYPDALAASTTGYVYFVNRDDRDGSTTIHRVDLETSSESTYTISTSLTNEWWSAGAINPQTGIYYLMDAVGRIYGFDTNTNTAIGYIGQTNPAMPEDFGDIAFDTDGNLYIYWANREIMKVAAADVPVTAQLSTKRLTATATGNATISYSGPYVSGLAWMSDEADRQLWSTDYTYQNRGIDAQTPGVYSSLQENVLTLPAPSSGYIYDMASCPSASAATPKLSLSKNVVARDNSTDQFGLRIEQPSGTTLASATTSGTATGVQSAVAGPIDVTAGTTYTLREVAAGTTDLSRYTSSLVCRDLATNTTIPTSGSDGVFTLAYPAEGVSNVSCTIMNSPPAAVTVTKTLPGGRFAASDQFTVELRTGGSTGTILNTPGTETTAGQGTTVDPGTGTTGKFEVQPGTAYTITESGEAGVDMSEYTSRITCTDPTGLQSGLPTDASFDPDAGFTFTPVAGAQVSCTVSNTASSGAGVGIGEGLTCEAGYVYAIASTYPGTTARSYSWVYKVSTTTGAATVAGLSELPTSWNNGTVNTVYDSNVNALAVSQGGLYSYYSVQRNTAYEPTGLPVFQQDNITGTTTRVATLNIPSSVSGGLSSTVRGGINPTDGIYWISASETVNGTTRHHFWAYNTLTGQSYGYVGYITGPVGNNGDLVFDQDGNMLLVTSTDAQGELWRVEDLTSALTGAPRTTATSIDSFVSAERLTTLDTNGTAFNGVTFDNDGYLYVSAEGAIQKLDPNTGHEVGSAYTITGLSDPDNIWGRIVVDLADCNDPGGIRLQKTYPDGRVDSSDNVTLSIVNAATPTTDIVGGTATTSGPAVGLQTEAASIVIGVPAKTYLLKETATSASTGKLPDYSTSLSCVDKTHGDADIDVTKVTQGEYSLDFPGVGASDGELLPNIVCTYSNTPNGTLQLEKQLGTDRDDDTDQFQVRILADGEVVESATTTGTDSTVDDGTTGVVRAQTGVASYTFDELGWKDGAESADVLSKYPNPLLTCADVNGLQPEGDLPNNMSLALFEGITPVPGSEIQCVITNSSSDARISVVKTGSTECLADGGGATEVIYTYTVTNTGLEPLENVAVTDDKGTPSYVSGDANGDGLLTAGEEWVYQMASSLTEPTTNIATATATGTESGDPALGRDTWSVNEASQLTTTKTSSATGEVNAGDTLTYTVKVTNDGSSDATNVTVNDTLPDGVSYVDGSAEKTYPTDEVTGTPKQTDTYTYTFTSGVARYLPAGSTTLSRTLTTANSGIPSDAVITGYSMTVETYKYSSTDKANLGATYPGGTALTASAVGGIAGAYYTTTRSTTQVSGTALGAYGLQFTNATTGFWLDSAEFTVTYEYGTGETTTRGTATDAAQAPAEMVTAADAITLKPGESMTLTYQVTVDDPLAEGITELTNTAASAWDDDTQCASTGSVTDPVAGVTIPPETIRVEKLGLNCDVGQATCDLPGAEFALYDTDPSVSGAAPITDGIAVDSADLSLFTSAELAVPGTYWLVETKAPDGFSLLATPVEFTLTSDGVTLAGASAGLALVKTDDPFTIQVLDATAAPLPEAGGYGPWMNFGLGLLLIFAAVVSLKLAGARPARRCAR